MPGPLPCDLCNTNEAVFLVTFMPNGDTLTICWSCPAAWAESLTIATDAAAAAGNGDGPDPAPAPGPDRPRSSGRPRQAPKTRKAAVRPSPPRPPRAAPGGAEGPENGPGGDDQTGPDAGTGQ